MRHRGAITSPIVYDMSVGEHLPVGRGPGTVVPVRFDADTLKALSQRAHDEGLTTRSDAIRAAVNQWLGLGS